MNRTAALNGVELVGQIAEHCKLLSDKSRLTILASLLVQDLCVCDLVELVGLSQPGVSQHLRKLRIAGIVTETRQGTWIYYGLAVDDKPHVRAVLAQLPSMTNQVRAIQNNC